MFPKVAPGFFKERPNGPKHVGRDPDEVAAERAAAAAGDGKTGPVRVPIKYQVTIDGKQHSVTVKPA